MMGEHEKNLPGSTGTPAKPAPPIAPARDEVAELVRLIGRPRRPVPEDVLSRARAAAHAEWTSNLRARQRRWQVAAALAAAASLLLALVVLFGQGPGSAGEQEGLPRLEALSGAGVLVASGTGEAGTVLDLGATVALGEVVVTPAQGQAAFRLPGGISVRLDASTRLRFLELDVLDLSKGAIYIDSPSGDSASPGKGGLAAGPLAVRTPLGVARDVGTQFEVRLESRALRIRVREGRVELTEAAAPATILAGEEIELSGDGSFARREVPSYGEEWRRWLAVAPPFELEGASLAELLHWLGRETGWQVQYADVGLALEAERIRLHGDLRAVGPEKTPSWVLETCGMDSRLAGGVLHVFRRVEGRHPVVEDRPIDKDEP